jgi:hypothetical protein
MEDDGPTLQILVVGRLLDVVDHTLTRVDAHGATLHGATTLDEVRRALARRSIDVMIVGAGIELTERMAIVRAAFELSENVSVHLKDRLSGRAGFEPFVQQVIAAYSRARAIS